VSPSDSGTDIGRDAASGPSRRPPDQAQLEKLAREQASLRRVATLVAGGVQPADVLTAVADELGRLVGAEATFVMRVVLSPTGRSASSAHPPRDGTEIQGYSTVVGSYGRGREELPVGSRITLHPGLVATIALQSGRPARLNGDPLASNPFGPVAAKLGMRACIATPIVVEGSYWGVTVAATSQEDFPPGSETRMADFMELAALAIAKVSAEQKLRELADTQASLRRLAMLIARGEPPDAVFAAVTKEALRHFGSGTARMIRYEPDGTATLLANEGTTGPHVLVGERWQGYPPTGLTATVQRTGRAARVNDYHDIPGGEPYLREGLVSAVALPIHVHGRLWGMIAVGSGEGPLPPDTEHRMTEFTDLIATAVANAQSRSELATSRMRLVAASDEARRRIERDLHDGAQQRLVALALRLQLAAAGGSAEARETSEEITNVAGELLEVIDELREVSRGIHPAILSEAGLGPALRTLGRHSAIPVKMGVRVDGRLAEPVEVGAYYVVSEALANAAKHARASAVHVDADISSGTLRVHVRDDGVGGADPARGSGLVGLKDRIEALGGTFTVRSTDGQGTTVSCELPATIDAERQTTSPNA
jgi:signal transduction histidine kinase